MNVRSRDRARGRTALANENEKAGASSSVRRTRYCSGRMAASGFRGARRLCILGATTVALD